MSFIRANWHASSRVVAGVSNRYGGHSKTPYRTMNLAMHVDDDVGNVYKNREVLAKHLHVSVNAIQFVNQVHGTKVLSVSAKTLGKTPKADSMITRERGLVLAILTADCLPVLLTNQSGTEVAAIHAGWRSLSANIIESTIEKMDSPADELMAWFGPAIGPKVFEVGEDVKDAFLNGECGNESMAAFTAVPGVEGKFMANIFELAAIRLNNLGVSSIQNSQMCTLTDTQWFSYRRNKTTGRMASFIAIR